MAYTRKIKTTGISSTAVEVNKIKVVINNEIKEVKKTIYSDAQRNLTEIFNKDAYYDVTFKNNETGNTIKSYKLKEGSKINEVPTPSKITGMDFSHWLLNGNSYTSEELYNIEINNDVVILAVYKLKEYTVYYYDYSTYLTEKKATHNSSPITDIEELGIPTPVGAYEVGYSKQFIGWSRSYNNTPEDLTNFKITSNITLFACFSKTPINYTIIFNYDTPYGLKEIKRVSNVKIGDNIYNLKPTRPTRYLLGRTSSWHYSNDFSYYKGTTKEPLNDYKTLTSYIIATYAVDKTIKLSLNYFEQPYPQPVLSSHNSNITPDYHGNPLVYFKYKFIAGGQGKVYYNDSPKTKPWTPTELPNNEVAICGFAHTNDTLVGFTNASPSMYRTHPHLIYSLDGITWYESSGDFIGKDYGASCIASYNDGFILSTLDGKIYTTTYAIYWTYRSTVEGGFTFGSLESAEQIRAITVTKNNIVIVTTNQNTSYCAEIESGTWTWRKIDNIPSDFSSRSTFLMSIPAEGDAILGRVLWLKNYGRVFELKHKDTFPYVKWEEVSNISDSAPFQTPLQKGFIYSNNRYFAVGDSGSYAHTPNITKNWEYEPLASVYNFTSIAASDYYVVMLANDTYIPNVKQVFTVDWGEAYALPIHTLTFNTQGGNSIEPIINVNKIPPSLPVPTKTGYTFLCWQFYNEGYGYWDAKVGDDIFADTTLYAKWKPNT